MNLEHIQRKIYEIRGFKVILDFDLACMYEVETRILNQAVKRNIKRFPPDFMFQLTDQELKNLMSQFVTSSWGGKNKCKQLNLKSNENSLKSNKTTSP